MKKLWNVFVLTLALNFLAVAGAVAYLYGDGRLDRQRVDAIKRVLFPPPTAPPAASQPSTDPVRGGEPVLRLGELLEQKSGLSTSEQLSFLQQTFDARMAELDRRQRELIDLQRQVDMANSALARDRTALDAEKKQLTDREQLAARLANDKGFQDSLALYKTMPSKQVKQVFMTMDDETVKRYLQAMEPRGAAKIVKEFKAPDELARIQRVLDQLRGSPAAAAASTPAPAAGQDADNAALQPAASTKEP